MLVDASHLVDHRWVLVKWVEGLPAGAPCCAVNTLPRPRESGPGCLGTCSSAQHLHHKLCNAGAMSDAFSPRCAQSCCMPDQSWRARARPPRPRGPGWCPDLEGGPRADEAHRGCLRSGLFQLSSIESSVGNRRRGALHKM